MNMQPCRIDLPFALFAGLARLTRSSYSGFQNNVANKLLRTDSSH
jgi:hypothetical protein